MYIVSNNYLNLFWKVYFVSFSGLHRRQGEVRQVFAAQLRPLRRQALPQGPVPDRGAIGQLSDDARTKQRKEADDSQDRQAQLRDHPPSRWRGNKLLIFQWKGSICIVA